MAVAFTSRGTATATSGTTVTISNVSCAAGSVLLVCAGHVCSTSAIMNPITGVTVNGNAATEEARGAYQNGNPNENASIYSYVPAGALSNVSVVVTYTTTIQNAGATAIEATGASTSDPIGNSSGIITGDASDIGNGTTATTDLSTTVDGSTILSQFIFREAVNTTAGTNTAEIAEPFTADGRFPVSYNTQTTTSGNTYTLTQASDSGGWFWMGISVEVKPATLAIYDVDTGTNSGTTVQTTVATVPANALLVILVVHDSDSASNPSCTTTSSIDCPLARHVVQSGNVGTSIFTGRNGATERTNEVVTVTHPVSNPQRLVVVTLTGAGDDVSNLNDGTLGFTTTIAATSTSTTAGSYVFAAVGALGAPVSPGANTTELYDSQPGWFARSTDPSSGGTVTIAGTQSQNNGRWITIEVKASSGSTTNTAQTTAGGWVKATREAQSTASGDVQVNGLTAQATAGGAVTAVSYGDTIGSRTYGNGGGNSAAATFDISYPASIAAGDLLILACYARNNLATAFSAPSGWGTVKAVQATANGSYAVYYKIAAGTESGTFTVTGSASNNTEVAKMVRIPGGSTTFTDGALETEAAGTSFVNAGVTPPSDNCLVVLVTGFQDHTTGSGDNGFSGWTGGTNLGTWDGSAYGTATGTDGTIGVGTAKQTTAAATGNLTVTHTSETNNAGISYSFAISPRQRKTATATAGGEIAPAVTTNHTDPGATAGGWMFWRHAGDTTSTAGGWIREVRNAQVNNVAGWVREIRSAQVDNVSGWTLWRHDDSTATASGRVRETGKTTESTASGWTLETRTAETTAGGFIRDVKTAQVDNVSGWVKEARTAETTPSGWLKETRTDSSTAGGEVQVPGQHTVETTAGGQVDRKTTHIRAFDSSGWSPEAAATFKSILSSQATSGGWVLERRSAQGTAAGWVLATYPAQGTAAGWIREVRSSQATAGGWVREVRTAQATPSGHVREVRSTQTTAGGATRGTFSATSEASGWVQLQGTHYTDPGATAGGWIREVRSAQGTAGGWIREVRTAQSTAGGWLKETRPAQATASGRVRQLALTTQTTAGGWIRSIRSAQATAAGWIREVKSSQATGRGWVLERRTAEATASGDVRENGRLANTTAGGWVLDPTAGHVVHVRAFDSGGLSSEDTVTLTERPHFTTSATASGYIRAPNPAIHIRAFDADGWSGDASLTTYPKRTAEATASGGVKDTRTADTTASGRIRETRNAQATAGGWAVLKKTVEATAGGWIKETRTGSSTASGYTVASGLTTSTTAGGYIRDTLTDSATASGWVETYPNRLNLRFEATLDRGSATALVGVDLASTPVTHALSATAGGWVALQVRTDSATAGGWIREVAPRSTSATAGGEIRITFAGTLVGGTILSVGSDRATAGGWVILAGTPVTSTGTGWVRSVGEATALAGGEIWAHNATARVGGTIWEQAPNPNLGAVKYPTPFAFKLPAILGGHHPDYRQPQGNRNPNQHRVIAAADSTPRPVKTVVEGVRRIIQAVKGRGKPT